MSSLFRSKYRELTTQEKAVREGVIRSAEEIDAALATLESRENGAREIAIARTKLEEAVMWASKGISA